MHTYEREIVPLADDSLTKIASRIGVGARVLDVGTGTGALGRYLSREKRCTVDGVTVNASEAAAARQSYRRVIVADLEEARLSELFDGERYDFIVCADVLEHVRNAKAVLTDLRALLIPEGRLLVSIPNVGHVGVLAQLCAGRFVRTCEGLLDATHVQFFDRRSFEALAQDAGFRIAAQDDVMKRLEETEFRKVDFAAIPKPVWSYLQAQPDAAVYQFCAELAPAQEEPAPSAPLPGYSRFEIVPRFAVQLYFDTGNGFNEDESDLAWLVADGTEQTARFELRTGRQAARALRIDFADRPGVFRFYGLEARTADGTLRWKWQGEPMPATARHELDVVGPDLEGAGVLMRSQGEDPWLRFDLDPATHALRDVTVLELRTSAPDRLGAQALAWAERTHRATLGTLQETLAGLQAEQPVLRAERAYLLGELEILRAQLQQAETVQRQQHDELRSLRQQLDGMLHSTSWRLTAGLRWLAARLRGTAH